MKLRYCTLEDLPFLIETERRFAEAGLVHSDDVHTHQWQMHDCDYAYYTVEDKGKPAGYVILRGLTSIKCSIELKRIVIAEPGRGLGRQVLGEIIDKVFHELRAQRLWLDVYEDNDRARHVYRSVGFVEEGTLPQSLEKGDRSRSLVVMSMLEDGN